jgi:hypothetical protein
MVLCESFRISIKIGDVLSFLDIEIYVAGIIEFCCLEEEAWLFPSDPCP